MKIIVLVFLAIIVSCWGKPNEKWTQEQLGMHMLDMMNRNIEIHSKWEGLQKYLFADGTQNNLKVAGERLDQLCNEYVMNPKSLSEINGMSQLCELLRGL